jgi:hypothetical protein
VSSDAAPSSFHSLFQRLVCVFAPSLVGISVSFFFFLFVCEENVFVVTEIQCFLFSAHLIRLLSLFSEQGKHGARNGKREQKYTGSCSNCDSISWSSGGVGA